LGPPPGPHWTTRHRPSVKVAKQRIAAVAGPTPHREPAAFFRPRKKTSIRKKNLKVGWFKKVLR